jgi:DNA-binding NtrC family response regulator
MMRNFCESEKLALLARFDFLDVCLLGETGTGKTHTARLIHDLSPRAKNSFNAVNCAELSPS